MARVNQLFCKDQAVNILRFGDHTVSVTVPLLCCCCNVNVAISDVNKGHGSRLSSNTTVCIKSSSWWFDQIVEL